MHNYSYYYYSGRCEISIKFLTDNLDCPEGWTQATGKEMCYRTTPNGVVNTYDGGKNACHAMQKGAILAEIRNIPSLEAIKKVLSNEKRANSLLHSISFTFYLLF